MGRKMHLEVIKNRSWTAGEPLRIRRTRTDDLLKPKEQEPNYIVNALFIVFGMYLMGHLIWLTIK